MRGKSSQIKIILQIHANSHKKQALISIGKSLLCVLGPAAIIGGPSTLYEPVCTLVYQETCGAHDVFSIPNMVLQLKLQAWQLPCFVRTIQPAIVTKHGALVSVSFCHAIQLQLIHFFMICLLMLYVNICRVLAEFHIAVNYAAIQRYVVYDID